MADIRVRNLNLRVAGVLRARAEQRGISLAEEIRRTLTASVDASMAAFARHAAAVRAATAGLDSVRVIRKQRDAWG